MLRFFTCCSCNIPAGLKKAPQLLLLILLLAVALSAGYFDDNPYAPDVPLLLHSPKFFTHEKQTDVVTFTYVKEDQHSACAVPQDSLTDRSPPL